jgi:hypothetical protein
LRRAPRLTETDARTRQEVRKMMIATDDARSPLSRSLLDRPGGFAWWYLEILDEAQSGLVLIWSFGLPFLPGYAASERRGAPEAPRDRPSLNLAVYERGRPRFWVLREFEPSDAEWDGAGRWRFGQTTVESKDAGLQRSVTVHLDCPMESTGERVTGTIRLAGPVPQGSGVRAPEPATHLWTPLCGPAFGTALLDLGHAGRLRLGGRAYHDRNGSEVALHALGIETWLWGHAACDDGERIFYVLWPRGGAAPSCLGFELDATGHLTELGDLELALPRARRTFWGMPTWPWLELTRAGAPWLRLELDHRVDSGPFYLRYLARARTSGGAEAAAMAEIITPDRIDLDRHRPLVRMRVAREGPGNSIWLPLFEGGAHNRISRLLRGPATPKLSTPDARLLL